MRPKIDGPVEQELERIQEEHEYPSIQETVRNVLREAGYDV